MFAVTPEPPYVAVIFSTQRVVAPEGVDDGYAAMAEEMDALAAQQPGYIGIESAREPSGFGITVSYWADEASAQAWKAVAAHREAQRRGREEWYAAFRTRVAVVHRASAG